MKEGRSFFLRVEKGQILGHAVSDEIRLGDEGTVVGRPIEEDDPGVGIPGIEIRDDYVSRGHAKLHYSPDEECFVVVEKEGGSRNGTFVNGEQIEPGKPYPLNDGDLLGLAKVGSDCRVVFRFREKNTTLAGAVSPDGSPAGGLVVDVAARRVWVRDGEVALRRKEFELLAFLYQRRGEACSKDKIAAHVWAEERGIVSQETIETDIRRIRERIEPEPSKPRYLITLPRFGYRLDV